jgi:hypothetical protein
MAVAVEFRKRSDSNGFALSVNGADFRIILIAFTARNPTLGNALTFNGT